MIDFEGDGDYSDPEIGIWGDDERYNGMLTEKNVKKCPSQEVYTEEMIRVALESVTIYPCKKCEYPVLEPYCCSYCGTSNPDTTFKEDEEWEKKYR